MNTADTKAVAERAEDRWTQAVDHELCDLLSTASGLLQLSRDAKTNTKRVYYRKKFDKITTEVMRMISVKDRLDSRAAVITEIKERAANEQA